MIFYINTHMYCLLKEPLWKTCWTNDFEVLNDHGITKERLASYERSITKDGETGSCGFRQRKAAEVAALLIVTHSDSNLKIHDTWSILKSGTVVDFSHLIVYFTLW